VPESCVPPEVPAEMRFYLDAFWTLSTDRTYGMGIGPIPWSAVDRYAQRLGIADDEVEYTDFVQILQLLDIAFLKQMNKDSKTPDKPKPKSKGGKKGR
jgi:hypothetical protein